MADFEVGDEVRAALPRAKNKRGVMGVNDMYRTWPEAKFDGATGTIEQINPTGPQGTAQYLVDFNTHDNSRVGIPWTKQWFREEWLQYAGERPKAGKTVVEQVPST